jgi:hypothetical protein
VGGRRVRRGKAGRERSGKAGGEVEAVDDGDRGLAMSARRRNGAKGKRTEILSRKYLRRYKLPSRTHSNEHASAVPDCREHHDETARAENPLCTSCTFFPPPLRSPCT